MPLPQLTPLTAAVGVVGAVWAGATIGLAAHVLSGPGSVTAMPQAAAPPQSSEAPRLTAASVPHQPPTGSVAGTRVVVLRSASASPSPTGSVTAAPSALAVPVDAVAAPSPSAAAPSPAASSSPAAASPDPSPADASPSPVPAPSEPASAAPASPAAVSG